MAAAADLTPVRVAILDSGIDSGHPEPQNKIADGESFVSSSWETDTNGHGTFVAGEIAAALNNTLGIAGVGFPAQLLVAKIVRSDGTISPDAEAKAIRWAVEHGARVINMSFGGVRVPGDTASDTFSPLEAAAVRYAVNKGVLVVAAVGNSDNAPTEPWGYAGYPAALPHVLGVSAIGRDGSVPIFSNRDRRYNDIAAPGEDIFSTLPRALTFNTKSSCTPQGYSDCGPPEFRRGEGTSFSAPLVVGAAAVLFGVAPWARADQVANALTRSAADADPDTGCERCTIGRDALTGWGLLDVEGARPEDERLAARRGRVRGQRRHRRSRRPSGAGRASGSMRRSTTGTTAWTSTRSSFGPTNSSLRASEAQPARTRISSSGSPGRRGSAPARRTVGSLQGSRSRPARSSGSG